MALSDRRLTGRDVLAKTFHAKTKRGYDPIEVDAYLELVAAQIDVLHGDIGRMEAAAPVAPTEVIPAPAPAIDPNPELQAEIEQLRLTNADLSSDLAQEQSVTEALRAENEQLRSQLASVAPPPPIAASPLVETPVVDVAPMPDADVFDAGSDGDGRASEESYELVLRMAHRTAEETIAQAHSRGDEIIAEAELSASQIAQESDRRAFEAANRVQTELASVNAEIETQRGELHALQAQTEHRRNQLRSMAADILQLADDETRKYEGVEVVDLRPEQSTESPA